MACWFSFPARNRHDPLKYQQSGRLGIAKEGEIPEKGIGAKQEKRRRQDRVCCAEFDPLRRAQCLALTTISLDQNTALVVIDSSRPLAAIPKPGLLGLVLVQKAGQLSSANDSKRYANYAIIKDAETPIPVFAISDEASQYGKACC